MSRKAPEDTIAAISTPPGEGAIGIVRLSGPRAVQIVHEVFVSSRGRDIREGKGRVFHGEIREKGAVLDEVLVHVMRAPHSYTCEDVVEINCHGGAGPLSAVLELVLRRGARLAEPGEFTRRAFLNGRIDLIQAEAVIDRIRAQTHAALRAAATAAQGHLSKDIHQMRDILAEALARVEASVDFPEEDLPDLVNNELQGRLDRCLTHMEQLLATSEAGRLVREGAGVAIAGRPNVGKSSLFNALLRDARAIVTSHPGTTRDVLEEVITISGIPVRLSDRAGLRTTQDEIEQIGVDVARGTLKSADAVLFVVDSSQPTCPMDEELAQEVAGLKVPRVLVLNKRDLAPDVGLPAWADCFDACVRVSATTGEGLTELEAALAKILLGGSSLPIHQGIITRAHQRQSLRRAADALRRLLDHFDGSPEFLSIDLREALHALGEITGETTTEEVLDRIFSTFCIGK